MRRNCKTIVTGLTVVLSLSSIAVFGAETNVKGMISGRSGETLIVNSGQGTPDGKGDGCGRHTITENAATMADDPDPNQANNTATVSIKVQ